MSMPQRVEQHRRYPNDRAFRRDAAVLMDAGWEVSGTRSVPAHRRALRLLLWGGPRELGVDVHYVRAEGATTDADAADASPVEFNGVTRPMEG